MFTRHDDGKRMFSAPKVTTPSPAPELRNAKREPLVGVTAMIRCEKGANHEGVVQDVSDGGLRISGDSTGLHSGEKVEVVIIIQGERIQYLGQVRHIDLATCTYGIHFESGPIRGEKNRETSKRCKACKKDYPDEHKFCFRCGQRLVGGSHTPAQPANGPN